MRRYAPSATLLLLLACSAEPEPEVAPGVRDAGETTAAPRDAGSQTTPTPRDGGTAEMPPMRDGGTQMPVDAGPPTTLELLSEPPEYAIAGVEYRYDLAVETNAVDVAVTLVDGPSGASAGDGTVVWTPEDDSTASFTIRIDADDLSLEQTFTVEVATPVPLVSQTIDHRLGGTITVTSTDTPLAGVSVTVPPNVLTEDREITIAALTGAVEPVPAGHTELVAPFVVLPEVPGGELEVTIPKPAGLTLGEDEFALIQTAVARPPMQAGSRGRFNDMVVTLDNLAPTESALVKAHLDQAARLIRLVSGRYLRLEGTRTRLYWNLAAGQTPPTANAERAIATAESTIDIMTGVGFGCRIPARVSIFVVDFTKSFGGFAYPGAVFLPPRTANAGEAEMRYVMTHELVHVAQDEMLPGWSYNPVDSWWAEAMATHGADEIYDDDVWIGRYGAFTQRLITGGLIGSKKKPRAYQLALFLKHLDVTQRFRFCRIMSLQSGALAQNRFDVAIQGSTGTEAVKHLSTFAAAYSAHRHPEIVEDIDKIRVLFTPQTRMLEEEPITVRFDDIKGAKAVEVRSPNQGPITLVARRLSSGGAGARISFYTEEGNQLVDLGDVVDDELVIEDAPNPVTMVVASIGLASAATTVMELEEGLRINGTVEDVNGEPVRAHVVLVEQPDVETYSTLEGGAFGLKRVNSSTHQMVTVQATCALDTNLTASKTVDLSSGTTIDAGALRFTGECPSVEILSPTDGSTVTYGPYQVRGLTNLPDDRLGVRVGFSSRNQTQIPTRPSGASSVLRSFDGLVANDWMEDEGDHRIRVFSYARPAETEITVTKRLPRIFGTNTRSSGCGGTCPRTIISSSPYAVADALEGCRASWLEACADRFSSCNANVIGGTTVRSGDGRTRLHYEQTLTCTAADCEWAGNPYPCDGAPYDRVWDANRNHWSGSDPSVGGGTIVEGFDCRATIGRSVFRAPSCPEEYNAYCSFEYSHDACRFCGDGQCNAFEQDGCPADCGSCGDGVCSADGLENEITCARDCGSCGDGVCSTPTEDATSCAADCACGNGVCDPSEVGVCAEDCD